MRDRNVADPKKPVDLIVANTMHEAAERIESLSDFIRALGFKKSEIDAQMNKEIARNLLMDIATQGNIKVVYAALKAIGAPSSADDIAVGLQAVRETTG